MSDRDSAPVRLADMRSLREIAESARVRPGAGTLESLERQRLHDEAYFRDRGGFDEAFLEAFPVPLPGAGRTAGDEAPLTSNDGHVLRYSNFAVVMSASRRTLRSDHQHVDRTRGPTCHRRPRRSGQADRR